MSAVGNWEEEKIRSQETWITIMVLPFRNSLNIHGLWFLQQCRLIIFKILTSSKKIESSLNKGFCFTVSYICSIFIFFYFFIFLFIFICSIFKWMNFVFTPNNFISLTLKQVKNGLCQRHCFLHKFIFILENLE